MALLLLHADVTVTVVHSRTPPEDVKSIVESSGNARVNHETLSPENPQTQTQGSKRTKS